MPGTVDSPAAPSAPCLPSIRVDGKSIPVKSGELLIAAAERGGVYIPRFCWHPRMSEVGMCRMCLVEIEGPRGKSLQPACMQAVSDGMVVDTQSPTVKKAQDGVLEFLLINHPLDCPVCDKGGECPLQDQTLTFGPGETRFVEEKRHFEKPIAISDLVYLDRERCILCDRCTRFSKEVSGDPLIQFVSRGNHTEVNTFPDHPYASYFSGNVVQICPVGALTARPYRFSARPWDLDQVESTCTSCAVGCRVVLQSSGDRLTRYEGVDSDPVNWGWLCDKGRFDFEHVDSRDRLTHPEMRASKDAAPSTVSWNHALARVAAAIGAADADTVAVLGGARLTNEEQYAWAKLAKGAIGTDHVDAQLGDGLRADVWLGLSDATIDDACHASVVVLLGADLKEELPVLFLRLRDAAANRGVQIVELGVRASGLSTHAAHTLLYRPGEAAAAVRALLAVAKGGKVEHATAGIEAEACNAAGASLASAMASGKGNGKVVVVFGRPSLAESEDSMLEALSALHDALPSVAFLPALRRANLRGALDMGLAPGLLPGRVRATDAGDWYAKRWTGLVGAASLATTPTGMEAASILLAASKGAIKVLILLGCDPVRDFPDSGLARQALQNAELVVAIDQFRTDSVSRADVVLPAAGYAEKSGTTTNIEGRITVLNAKVTAPGLARPDWMIAVELAAHLGVDLGVESLADLAAEMWSVAPSHLGLTGDLLAAHPDGVLVPLSAPAAGNEPPLVAFLPPQEPAPVPQPDAYSLRLAVARTLYDQGTLLSACPSLRDLTATETALHLNPGEAERHGLRTGDSARVLTTRGTSVVLPVVADPRLPRGTAFVPFNHVGAEASELIDFDSRSAEGITKVRLESVRPESEADDGAR